MRNWKPWQLVFLLYLFLLNFIVFCALGFFLLSNNTLFPAQSLPQPVAVVPDTSTAVNHPPLASAPSPAKLPASTNTVEQSDPKNTPAPVLIPSVNIPPVLPPGQNTSSTLPASTPSLSGATEQVAIAQLQATETDTPIPSPTSTPTHTPSHTPNPTATSTNTSRPTTTPTRTPTNTPRPTATNTPRPTVTPTRTPTNTPRPTATNTPRPTATPTRTPTNTPGPTVTNTPRPTVTSTQTPTSTPRPTATNTPRPMATPTRTPTNTPGPTATNTPRPTPTATPTKTPTNTPRPTATNTPRPTVTSTRTPTNTPQPTKTPRPTQPPTHTPRPTSTPTRIPTRTPKPSATPTRTPIPSPTATTTPTPTFSPTPPKTIAAVASTLSTPNTSAAQPIQPNQVVAGTVGSIDVIPLTNGSVALSWLPIAKALQYRIYSDMGSGYGVYVYKARTTQPAFVDKRLRPGVIYSYRLTRLEADQEIVLAQVDANTFTGGILAGNNSGNHPEVSPASVVAVPTALPPDAILLGLVSNNNFTDDFNTLTLVGEVRNDSNLDIGQTDITVTFYNAAGTVIGTANGETLLKVIPPGEKSPFHLTLTRPPGFASYSLRAVARPVPPQQSAQLSVVELRRFEDDAGFFHIKGIIENVGSSIARRTKVAAIIYGRDGGVINVGFTYVNPPMLTPGKQAAYDVIFAYYPRYLTQQVIPFEE